MNLVTALERQAAERPDAVALVTSRLGADRRRTFEDIRRDGATYAEQLAERGIGRGDAVIVFVPMSTDLYVVLSAIWRIGAVAAFLDPSAGREHVRRCAELIEPKAFIATRRAQMLRVVSATMRGIPTSFVVGGRFPGAHQLTAGGRNAPSEIVASADDEAALVTFTSGSTGQPKAAVRTHGFLLAQYDVLAADLDLRPGQVDLATLPIFALANLAAGVTTVIPDADLRKPGEILAGPVVRQCARLGVTRCASSPAFLERIVSHAEQRGEVLDLRQVFVGGAPVFPPLLDRLRAVAPHAEVHAVYGSTEAEPIADITVKGFSARDRTRMHEGGGLLVGRPVDEIELRILDRPWGEPVAPMTAREFEEACAPAGETGGVVVSGRHVLGGYLHGTGDHETKFEVDGVRWHRTGDAGYLDERGRLWLLGREVARVDDEKGTLWPFAVETAAAGFPGLARSALVGWNGMRVLAVQAEKDASVDLEGLSDRLAWAALDRILPLRSIPVDKRHNAKVDYPALTALLSRELEQP